MLAGYIKPLVVCISRPRFRYRVWGLMDKDLPVICYDMKGLVVGDAQFLFCHRVPWRDIRLVESEKVVQSQTINKTVDNSRTVEKHKKYAPMFGPKSKASKKSS
jgi:uncharacterized Fe-S cluster-containing protein